MRVQWLTGSRLCALVGCLATDNAINAAGKCDCSSQNLLCQQNIFSISLSIVFLNLTSVSAQTKILQYDNTYSEFVFVHDATHTDKCACLRHRFPKKSPILPVQQ